MNVYSLAIDTFEGRATALGPRDCWPRSLAVLVDLMQASIQPMAIVWGLDRHFICNDAYAPILGRPLAETFGRPFFEVWPEAALEIGALFDRVFDGQPMQRNNIALELESPSGPKEAYFSFSYTPVRDDNGRVAGVFCICTETTGEVHAQRQARGERLRQRQMLRQMPGLAAILSGPEHVLDYANDAFVALTGARGALGLPVGEVFPEVAALGFLQRLDQVYRTGVPFNTRAAPIQFDGQPEVRFIDLTFQPLKDHAERTTGVFVGGYDVTTAERSFVALRKTEGLLASIVASSDDAIISKTIEGVVTSWNAGAERIFGYSAAEIVGQPISRLAAPGREHEMPALLERLVRGERVEHFETLRRHKDGSNVLVSLTVSPIHDDTGRVVGASKVARDITASRAAAEALAAAQVRLLQQHSELLHAARLGELGQMAATLAHEINQPLSAVVNYLYATRTLIGAADIDRPMLDQSIKKAAEQAVRAAEVVRRLRTFSRPHEGMLRPESMHQLVTEIIDLATIDAGRRGVAVQLLPHPDDDMVMADRIEVQQVLLNLIRNALEAMDGQDRRELTLSITPGSDTVEFAVMDTGAGLDQRVRDHLFQPFVTTKSQGMGIGLSICRKIIEAHGGAFWAEDRAGGGTIFRFTLRRAPTAAEPMSNA